MSSPNPLALETSEKAIVIDNYLIYYWERHVFTRFLKLGKFDKNVVRNFYLSIHINNPSVYSLHSHIILKSQTEKLLISELN